MSSESEAETKSPSLSLFEDGELVGSEEESEHESLDRFIVPIDVKQKQSVTIGGSGVDSDFEYSVNNSSTSDRKYEGETLTWDVDPDRTNERLTQENTTDLEVTTNQPTLLPCLKPQIKRVHQHRSEVVGSVNDHRQDEPECAI